MTLCTDLGKLAKMDSLQVIPDRDIPKLLQMLEEDLPESLHAYSYLKTLIEWKKKKPSIDAYILAPDGDFSDGTFMLYTLSSASNRARIDGTIYSRTEAGVERLRKALVKTLRIEWDNDFQFTCLPEHVTGVISKMISEKISTPGRPGKTTTTLMWIPSQYAAEMEAKCPEGMYMGPLEREHSAKINSLWPHNFPGSEQFIAENIKLNFGLGLFEEVSGKLVAWGLHWFYGGLGIVQTEQDQRRKGYGEVIVRHMTKKLGTMEWDVHACVVSGNVASLQLFLKLQFQPLCQTTWIHT